MRISASFFGVGFLVLSAASAAWGSSTSSSSGDMAASALGLDTTTKGQSSQGRDAGLTPSSKPASFSDLLGDLPSWMGRIHGEATFDHGSSPHFALETVQPYWRSEDLTHTVFAQGRVSWTSGDWTLNYGSGYRYLAPSHEWMLGGNAFFDTQVNDGHKRLGLGAEAMQSYLTFRTNYYDGFSGWRTVDRTSSSITQERALSGYDFGLEGPVPYMQWARLFVTYYTWDATVRSDIHGAQTKLRMKLSPYVAVDVGGGADQTDYSVFTKISLSFGRSGGGEASLIEKPLSAKAFEPRDLSQHTLDPVERQNEIVTERRTLSTGSVSGARVIVRRGS